MKKTLIIYFTNNDVNALRKGLLIVKIDCGIEEEQVIIDAIVNNKDGLLDIINKYQNDEGKADFAKYYQDEIRDDIADLTVDAVRFLCSDGKRTDTCNRCIKTYKFDILDFMLFAELFSIHISRSKGVTYGTLRSQE